MDPALVAAVERTAKRLEALGHHVEEAVPDYDAAATGTAFGTVMCANTFTNIQVRANGRVPGPDDLEPVTRLYAEQGGKISAHDYIRAVQTFHRTGRQLGAFFEKFDILLSPTIARPRCRSARVRMDGRLEQYEEGLAPMVPFTVRLQRHGRAGHVGAAGMDGRRPAHRHAFRRPLRRRGHPVVTGGPA